MLVASHRHAGLAVFDDIETYYLSPNEVPSLVW
jgi:hypothetical protein